MLTKENIGEEMEILKGIGASSGIASGKAYLLKNQQIKVLKKNIEDPKLEIAKLTAAISTAKEQIEKLQTITKTKLGQEKSDIFEAHLQILVDPELINTTIEIIQNQKFNAGYALKITTEKIKKLFLALKDPYMRERVADIDDIKNRLLHILANKKMPDLSLINEEVIVVAHDLTPSDTAQLDPKFIKGFITEIGGKTSHSAIIARSLEIPAIVGIGKKITKISDGKELLLDGEIGELIVQPNPEKKSLFGKRAHFYQEIKKEEALFANKQGESADHWTTKIAMNISRVDDLKVYQKMQVNGIGLFRTEFLYMEKDHWPTEAEQFDAYKKVLKAVKDEVVVIRTLDIGGDKTLSYYKFPKESNPFLGYRAIRLELDKKEIFITQIRALLRASIYGKLAINLPMITTIEEFKQAKDLIFEIKEQLAKEGIKVGEFQLGIMVEVPATVILIDKFVKYADFFSIGTNDLIQYTFAVDRMSKTVSYLYQPLNPAILRLIKMVIDVAHQANKWVAICGELASEAKLVPVFAAMGLDEFSMSSSSILKIKRILAKIEKSELTTLLNNVLNCETEQEVEGLLNNYFEKKQLIY